MLLGYIRPKRKTSSANSQVDRLSGGTWSKHALPQSIEFWDLYCKRRYYLCATVLYSHRWLKNWTMECICLCFHKLTIWAGLSNKLSCLKCDYTTLHTTLHTNLHYTLHYTAHYTTLHYTTLHYTTLHYTTLYYTTLHNTTQHNQMVAFQQYD